MHCVNVDAEGKAWIHTKQQSPPLRMLEAVLGIAILIVEGRIPRSDCKHGCYEGPHCFNYTRSFANEEEKIAVHRCDLLNNPFCIQLNTYYQQIKSLWDEYGSLSIEVVICSDCVCGCDYILEQWSIMATDCIDGLGQNSRVSWFSLLQAVKSQLHFSQLCAWWTNNGSQAPKNICYRIVPVSRQSESQVRSNWLCHSFPLFSLNTNKSSCLQVKLKCPPRTDKLPDVYCSLHANSKMIDDRELLNCNRQGKHCCDDADKFDEYGNGFPVERHDEEFGKCQDMRQDAKSSEKNGADMKGANELDEKKSTCSRRALSPSVKWSNGSDCRRHGGNVRGRIEETSASVSDEHFKHLEEGYPMERINRDRSQFSTCQNDSRTNNRHTRLEDENGCNNCISKFVEVKLTSDSLVTKDRSRNRQCRLSVQQRSGDDDDDVSDSISNTADQVTNNINDNVDDNDDDDGDCNIYREQNSVSRCSVFLDFRRKRSDWLDRKSLRNDSITIPVLSVSDLTDNVPITSEDLRSEVLKNEKYGASSKTEDRIEKLEKSGNVTGNRSLLGNFVECVLKERFDTKFVVYGFKFNLKIQPHQVGPQQTMLPLTLIYYSFGEDVAQNSYLAKTQINSKRHCVPTVGSLQITLLNDLNSVVQIFFIQYDLSKMVTTADNDCAIVRQRIYHKPVTEFDNRPEYLKYVIDSKFRRSKSGRIYLYDVRMIILHKLDIEAANEFGQNANYTLFPFTECSL